ncbi:hypothetical protein QOT17_017770 [Balamuthia mandrillaris]
MSEATGVNAVPAPRAKPNKSPKIKHIEQGKIVVGNRTFKDAIITPHGVEEWDWNDEGTQHIPGIKQTELRRFLDEVDEVVIAYGTQSRLMCPEHVTEVLESNGIKVHVLQPMSAAETYNRLRQQGIRVGALFHTTS